MGDYQAGGLSKQLVFLTGDGDAILPAGLRVAGQENLIRFGLLPDEIQDAVDLLKRNIGGVQPDRLRDSRRQVKHVAPAQQLLRAHLVQDGPRVNLGGHLKGDPGREIGLDQPGDDVHRWSLGGQHQVDPHRPGHLGQPRDRFLHLLARGNHQVGQLVHDNHQVGDPFQLGVPVRLAPIFLDIAHARLSKKSVPAFHLPQGGSQPGYGVLGGSQDVFPDPRRGDQVKTLQGPV